jgi:hypothetical protein
MSTRLEAQFIRCIPLSANHGCILSTVTEIYQTRIRIQASHMPLESPSPLMPWIVYKTRAHYLFWSSRQMGHHIPQPTLHAQLKHLLYLPIALFTRLRNLKLLVSRLSSLRLSLRPLNRIFISQHSHPTTSKGQLLAYLAGNLRFASFTATIGATISAI